jgi:hypothetical protein
LSFKKLPLRRRLTSNFEIITRGNALLVDAAASELITGARLEVVIRKLDDEGRNGLIIYGPAYRVAFRDDLGNVKKQNE